MSEEVTKSHKKAKKSKKNRQHKTALDRAKRVWKYVHIDGMTLAMAWKKAFPFTKAKKPNWHILAIRACELFEREKKDDIDDMLRAAGLGLPRVVEEIHKGLTQKKVELYQGEVVTDKNGNEIHFDDNMIQQRMRESLIKIHGLEKRIMEHTGKGGGPIQFGVVELPMKKTPNDWNEEHGEGSSEGLDASAEATERS